MADNSSDCVLDLELDYASSQDDVQANVEVGAEKNNKKFTAAQQDTLNWHSKGMFPLRAALESSLTITQVKVIEQGGWENNLIHWLISIVVVIKLYTLLKMGWWLDNLVLVLNRRRCLDTPV